MPDGMKENDFFAAPIITPSTKAEQGHDEDISKEDIIAKGIVSAEEWKVLEKYTLQLFDRGRQLASKRGLILVDTKYEFGRIGSDIYLMDEIHTPDSSRYFYAERQERGERQLQLSKEFVREWLIANDFMGKEGQTVPSMSDEWITTISKRYIELYEKVIGEKFVPLPLTEQETDDRIIRSLKSLKHQA
jgi:phosphoribosylaminoimidazole-succinocarboxamide synthase